MPKLVPIVEGPGEVSAVPVLLHKILRGIARHDIQVATPKNAHGRSNLLKVDGIEKFIRHAWKEKDCGAIIVIIDTEGDCPCALAASLAARARALGTFKPVMIVCAHYSYEAWLIASIQTMAGRPLGARPGIKPDSDIAADPDSVKGGKAWIERQLPRSRAYKETEDQEAMTRLLDPELALTSSRSFRRIWHAVQEAAAAIDTGGTNVTPTECPAKG